MYKLLLINPRTKKLKNGLGAFKSTTVAPLSLAYLAALTPSSKYDIRIVDENIEMLTGFDADLVGITSYTAQINRASELSSLFRSKNIPVVMGGIHVSMVPQEALHYCDAVVIGEAENIWHKVLKDFERGSLKRIYEGSPVSLDQLPIPDRWRFKNEKYLWGSIVTSKGCPMDCLFCSVTRFNGRKFRRRPLESVLTELAGIKNRYLWILDDNILGYGENNREWLKNFFYGIIKRKIKKYFFVQASLNFGDDIELVKLAYKAGVRMVLVGIESVDKNTLVSLNKKLNAGYSGHEEYLSKITAIRKGGIAVLGCFILGTDTDTKKSFGITSDFIRKAKIDVLQLSKPTPLPGTAFFEMLDRDNRILDKNYPAAWKDYKFTRMLYKPDQLSIEEVYKGSYFIRKIHYSTRQKIKRTISTLIDTRSVTTTIFALLFNHTYERSWKNSELYKNYDWKMLMREFGG